MAKTTEELASALTEVIEDVETSTTEEAVETTSEEKVSKQSGKERKAVPYERFAEVIGEKNTLKEQLEALSSEKESLTQSLQRLTTVTERAQSDLDTLNQVRGAINSDDPRVVDAVKLIDTYLKGELEDIIEDEDLKPEEAVEKTKALLNKTKFQLEDQHADLKADLIIQKADALADKWLDALPEEYNPQDRDILSRLWTDMIDWDTVEETPNLLESELAEKFQEAINLYGVPRGALLSPDDLEFVDENETSAVPTPEEELRQLIGEKEYGAIGMVKTTSGKEVLKPKVSDEDFTADIAKAMKIANRSRR